MKKLLLTSSILVIASLAVTSTFNLSNAHSGGAPNGYTGAPLDNSGLTCAASGCHTGSAVTSTTGVISSNIPGSGFVAGTTYNFTLTMAGAAAYGFEVTAQTPTSSSAVGTLIASGAGTKVSGNYITHSSKKTGTSAIWTFQWTAPSTGTTVTIYGAFNYANNNNNNQGDIIKKSSATYLANTTGVNEMINNSALLSVYPNPTSNFLHINSAEVFTKGNIFSIDGKLVRNISENELESKMIFVSNISAGLYYVNFSNGEENLVAKFTKND